jgi:hypothetical protein
MTEEEIVAAADPDARPMTSEELRSAKRMPPQATGLPQKGLNLN